MGCNSDSSIIKQHAKFLVSNANPKDNKGNELTRLSYNIEDPQLLKQLLDAFLSNKSFTGELEIHSSKFTDSLGFKLSQIIQNNKISSLQIGNKSHPFSDRVSLLIGDALVSNTNLKVLETYLVIDKLSLAHVCQFISNKDSALERLSYLKMNKGLFDLMTTHLNVNCRLKFLGFYYEPLKHVDLLYGKQ